MKFTSEKSTIVGPLLAARDIAVNNSRILALSMVRLSLSGDTLQITATDLDTEYRNSITVNPGVDGELLVNAQKIADIVKSLPDGCQIEFASDDKADDGIVIKSGRSRFRLGALPVDQFPNALTVSDAAEFTLSQDEYSKGFGSTIGFVSQDPTRFYLCAVHLRFNGGLIFEATNGHAVSKVKIEAPLGSNPLGAIGCVIPAVTVQKLLKLVSGDTLVRVGPTLVSFAFGSSTFVSKLVDVQYPDIDRAIPQNAKLDTTVKASDLKVAVNRIALVGGDENIKAKSSTLRLEISESSMVISGASAGDEGVEEIEVVSTGDIVIGFEPKYLALAVNTCDCDEVKISFVDRESAAIFRAADDNGVMIVVMPKRIL